MIEEAADDLIGVGGGAEVVELIQNLSERLFDIADGAFRVVLTLLFQTALTFQKLFSVEIGTGMKDRIALGARIGQEARYTVP